MASSRADESPPSDDHDILDFSVSSIFTDQQKPAATEQLQKNAKQKYDEEFARQMKEYEEERQKFKEAHPDKAKDDDEFDDPNKYYEDATARELRLIYESQNAIHQVISGRRRWPTVLGSPKYGTEATDDSTDTAERGSGHPPAGTAR